MIKIKKYEEHDLESIQQISFMMWLELQWNKDFHAQDMVVASTTVWEIGDGRSAIENIFTIPDYRHQGIAKAIISTGFQLKYNLYEMHYTL